MFDCNNLLHPFQNDPGISQHQRVMDDLLSGAAKIDGRSMADLLDYFMQLSRHINYYDKDLNTSDWQPFFQKSLPFTLAAIIKYDRNKVTDQIEEYAALFEKHPSKAGLQLLFHYLFYEVIGRINTWHLQLKDSGLSSELVLLKLIKDKLRDPLIQFICYHNVAVTTFCIKPLNFLPLLQNEVWDLDTTHLHNTDCKPETKTKRERRMALYNKTNSLLPVFLDAIRIIGSASELCMEQSFFPLKEELQKKHTPHLALLFAFLKLFQHLQADLNSFTKKHLDFFYREILKLKAKEAVPDKAHLVFEIQKQLDHYLLKKGLLTKDGKDNNKAEILFSLDDEIVVNKAQVADKRTLFLNNKNINENTYLEGVYMAPDAGKADGISKPFKDSDPPGFPTLGAKLSKYTDPEKSLPQPYPNARLGFILASPVLLLNEGERTIDITLACELKHNLCKELPETEVRDSDNCCEERDPNTPEITVKKKNQYEDLIGSEKLYELVKTALEETYYYISEDLIVEASKKGISKDLEKKLRQLLTKTKTKDNSSICYCPVEVKQYDIVLKENDWIAFYNTASANEKKILDELFSPLKPLKLLFSGEKEWIAPVLPPTITVSPTITTVGDRGFFVLKVTAVLHTDQPAVTFYDKDKLKEDFNTTLPLVKIELDDKIKMLYTKKEPEKEVAKREGDCCLLKELSEDRHAVSLYHFFRNVIITNEVNGENTRVDVRVCGLKNLIVQNDESVQDVNSPIYPFGTRPKAGASFYVGSKEIFSKDWEEIFVNTQWKDKPDDLGVHYKHYSYKNTTFEDGSKEIVNSSFLTTASVLDKGEWKTNGQRRLFKFIPGEQGRTKPLPPGFPPVPAKPEVAATFCGHPPALPNNKDVYDYSDGAFVGLLPYKRRKDLLAPLTPYNVTSQYGFLRFTLEGVSFQHDIFPFVLTRQMMAYAGLLSLDVIQEMVTKANDAKKIIEAMIVNISNVNLHVGHIQTDIGNVTGDINTLTAELGFLGGDLNNALVNLPGNIGQAVNEINHALGHVANITNTLTGLSGKRDEIQAEVDLILPNLTDNPVGPFDSDNANDYGLIRLAAELKAIIQFFVDNLQVDPELKDGLPNEPWTPVIKNISIDYTATAENTDIDLIHLYPYENTYKHSEITLQPALFPTFCDEGNLFIGLQDLVPGDNLNILFQLAEATADSESDPEEVSWYYLDNNQWKTLRNGFEILDDATNGLTATGIIKFALPENITSKNTILPKGLHWIRASVPKNSRVVCETIGIHTQAIRSTFVNNPGNDQLRLAAPLAAGKITRLNEADTSIKKISQPYDSYGGRVPEAEGHFYVRVSELLRHKGRAIQKFDYERLALEAFPQLFKVKCINHSFALNAHQYKNDFPFAPGYVVLAVIPDLNRLKAAQSFEPGVPVSMLENIAKYMKERVSPFVRFRAMNPRYEKINFCVKVKLLPGKDENYYKEKLKRDIREVLAPWAVGKYEKLSFGQCVNRSDVIRLLETSDYVDFISALCMVHEEDEPQCAGLLKSGETILSVCPKTPRSILIAGDIDVCIPGRDCEKWGDPECENEVAPIADYCSDIIID